MKEIVYVQRVKMVISVIKNVLISKIQEWVVEKDVF